MVPHVGRLGQTLRIRWTRAHGAMEQAEASGVPADAWFGHTLADTAAKAEAKLHAPEAGICLERSRFLALHHQMCRLIASVQEAHMEVVRHHPPANTPIAKPALRQRHKRRAPRLELRPAKVRKIGTRIARASRVEEESGLLSEPPAFLFGLV